MRIRFLLLLLLPGISLAQPLKLWYKQPAATGTRPCRFGNGRLGAMMFGKIDEELLQLNESTLWSGGPVNPNPNPTAPTYLPQIRKALDEENYELRRRLPKKCRDFIPNRMNPWPTC